MSVFFAFSEVCLRCRLVLPHWLPLPLTGFPAPYSPDPLPRRGRGGFIVILCKGLRPLHPRGMNPRGTGVGASHVCGGGLPLPRRLGVPLVLLLPPIPPTPFPQRGRGRFIVILCKGLRPLHSRGAEPARHWGQGANYVLGGRCAFLGSGCHCL